MIAVGSDQVCWLVPRKGLSLIEYFLLNYKQIFYSTWLRRQNLFMVSNTILCKPSLIIISTHITYNGLLSSPAQPQLPLKCPPAPSSRAPAVVTALAALNIVVEECQRNDALDPLTSLPAVGIWH